MPREHSGIAGGFGAKLALAITQELVPHHGLQHVTGASTRSMVFNSLQEGLSAAGVDYLGAVGVDGSVWPGGQAHLSGRVRGAEGGGA